MAELLNMPRAAWKRQPQGAVGISRSNPITSGLSLLLPLFGSEATKNLITGENSTLSSALSNIVTKDGRSLLFGTSAYVDFVNPTSITSGSQPITISWIQEPRSPSGYAGLLNWKPIGASSAFVIFQQTGADSNYNFVVGPRVGDYTKLARFSDSIGELTHGKNDFFVLKLPSGTGDCSDAQLWKNGVAIVRNTSTNFNNFGSNTADSSKIGALDTGSDPFEGIISNFAIWGRALSDPESMSISANPWQLFASAPSRFYLIPSEGGVITLIVQDATHSHSVDAPSLTQAHVLTLADSLHGHSVESPILSQAYALTLAAAAHAHNADHVELSQAHSLNVAESAHSHSVDNIALTQAYVLALADSTHAHSSEAPTLSTGLSLSPADTAHGQSSESPALIQAHILNLSDATHGHSADTVSMGQGYTLTVADTAHGHSVEAPTVTVAFVLAVQDALHSLAAEALALATHITLVVSDALHAHLAGSASEITLPTGDRIFLVANEDRLFLVANSDRLFGV